MRRPDDLADDTPALTAYTAPENLVALVLELRALSADNLMRVLDLLREDRCLACGSAHLPCHCQNDD